MAGRAIHTVLDHLRRLHGVPQAAQRSDRELLHAFVNHGDQDAFAAVVTRHAPLVWGVCRRVLGHHQDAEDAFQATFLILARRAGSVRWQASVGGWLHTVAQRLAVRARKRAEQLRIQERKASRTPPGDSSLRELAAVLDEELRRLPAKYREPVLLHYLQGATAEAAAHQLGLSRSTFYNRLANGRELLRERLRRQGLSLAAPLLAAALTPEAASAAPSLILATIRGVRGNVPQPVAALVAEALAFTVAMKLKVGLGLILLLGVAAAGAAMLVPRAPLSPIAQAERPADPPKANAKAAVRVDRYGDPLPEGAISRLGTTRLRHSVFVSWLQFTPDGQSLISQGGDGIRIWKVDTAEQLHHFPNDREPQQMPHEGCSLSADGKRLAVPGKSDVSIFDVRTGRRLQTIATGKVTGARFSPDGELLAVQSDDQRKSSPFQLWDVASGRLIRSGGEDETFFACLAFAGDGKTLITAGSRYQTSPPAKDYQIRFWETASGKELRTLHMGPSNPRKIALSPDGTLLAVIGQGDRGTENRIRLWDVAGGKELRQLVPTAKKPFPEVSYYSTALAFAPDGRTLYTGGIDGTVIAWDPFTGKDLRHIGTGLSSPRAIAVSPDHKTLAVDVVGVAIRLVDIASGTDRFPDPGHSHRVLRTAITPDGRTAVTGDQSRVIFWDAATGRELRRIGGDDLTLFTGLQLIRDGRALLTTELDGPRQIQTLRMWDLATGKKLLRRTWPKSGKKLDIPLAVAPDGKTVTLWRPENAVVQMDLETGKEVRTFPRPGTGAGLLMISGLTPDGRTLIVWDHDTNQIRLHDLASGRELRRLTFADKGRPPARPPWGVGTEIHTVRVSPDGRLLVCGGSTGVRTSLVEFYDLPTGRLVRKLDSSPDDRHGMEISPDGRTLALGGVLIELATGRERHRFVGHKGRIHAVAFSADGTALVTAGDDTTALVWDLTGRLGAKAEPGKPLARADLDACWADLAGEDAARAYQAIRRLAAAPASTVPFLTGKLVPVPAVDEKRLARLVADLDSQSFTERTRATKELEGLGELAAGHLQKALAGKPSLEVSRRVEALLEKQGHASWHPDPDRVRVLRALEVLESIGTPEARQVLERLAAGAPEARPTREAKAAVERLARRTTP
jgi:RNA polymerase sigma factor (sigma-70 family)